MIQRKTVQSYAIWESSLDDTLRPSKRQCVLCPWESVKGLTTAKDSAVRLRKSFRSERLKQLSRGYCCAVSIWIMRACEGASGTVKDSAVLGSQDLRLKMFLVVYPRVHHWTISLQSRIMIQLKITQSRVLKSLSKDSTLDDFRMLI